MKHSSLSGKLSFGSYPYTITRVKVMQSFLIKPDDYYRMKKMGTNEIVRVLEEGEYKKEIDALSNDYQGLELIELALNENLAKTMNKLLKIAIAPPVQQVIRSYANKWIVNNCKAIIRARFNQSSLQDLQYAIIPIVPITYQDAEVFLREPLEDMALRFASFTGADRSELQAAVRDGNGSHIEYVLDRAYFNNMIKLRLQLNLKPTDPLREFLRNLTTALNIKNILRLQAVGTDQETIRKFVLRGRHRYGNPQRNLLANLLHARDFSECISIIKASPFHTLVTEGMEKNLTVLEDRLEQFLLQQASSLLHRKPLSISPIFGYLLQKEIELRNIRLLLHARNLGLPEEFVDQNLLIAS
ncbi:MAG: V-type ATPase subunit [Nanoarchaeota archaeon]|nr:V-type ATPase subunit [Nanoarchaeota archaeon]